MYLSLSGFSFTNIHDSQGSRGREDIFLRPLYQFLPLQKHFRTRWVITAGSNAQSQRPNTERESLYSERKSLTNKLCA